MIVLEEQIKFCPICNMETKHHRNRKKYNWLMHIFLTLITGGIWVIILILPFFKTTVFSIFSNPNKGWICTVCNNIDNSHKKKETKKEPLIESLTSYIIGFGAIAIIITIIIFILVYLFSN